MNVSEPDLDGAALRIYTLGGFSVWREGEAIERTAWGREKAIHLFQFFVTNRGRLLHKEQIIDHLWPESPLDAGDRDFKVALNAINRTIEPERLDFVPQNANSFFKSCFRGTLTVNSFVCSSI